VKNEKCDTLTNSHSILNWWKDTYQLLNVHGVRDIRQNEINTAEPLGTQPGASEVETAIIIIIIIIIYLSWRWATCWPILVSRIQKSLQRSAM